MILKIQLNTWKDAFVHWRTEELKRELIQGLENIQNKSSDHGISWKSIMKTRKTTTSGYPVCQRRNKNKLENILNKIMKTRHIKTCEMQLKQGLDIYSLKCKYQKGKKTENQCSVCLSLYDLFHVA